VTNHKAYLWTLFCLMVAVFIAALAFGCTEQERAKSLGGDATVNLPCDTKLLNVTWKADAAMWYLTRPMHKDEKAEAYTFKESAAWGLLEGKVTIKECKTEGPK